MMPMVCSVLIIMSCIIEKDRKYWWTFYRVSCEIVCREEELRGAKRDEKLGAQRAPSLNSGVYHRLP
jgi:hypothetical protein